MIIPDSNISGDYQNVFVFGLTSDCTLEIDSWKDPGFDGRGVYENAFAFTLSCHGDEISGKSSAAGCSDGEKSLMWIDAYSGTLTVSGTGYSSTTNPVA